MSIDVVRPQKTRLVSLDFFRGVTVAAMILVNNPGDWGHIYSPLEHSVWNGCTPTDLIFPFFLFMVGVSINYAIGPKKEDKLQHKRIILAAAKRSVIIYILFAMMALLPHFDFAHYRILGVLPRIAIVFFICAVLFVKTTQKTQLWLFFSILFIYYILMTYINVPGYGPANLEPGTNLAAWLDKLVLTEPHMWSGTKTWDPEGILSTLPAVATCLFGVLVGSWLRRKDKQDAEKVAWLFTIAIFAVIGGLIWDTFFPINKALWTSSFVLYTGGLATAGLTLSFWLIDVKQRKKYTEPFIAFGANAITAYVAADVVLVLLDLVHVNSNGHRVGLQQYLYNTFFVPYFSPVNASLAGAITYVLILLVPIWILYKKKKFIKI
jgi:predicted acyltransferase